MPYTTVRCEAQDEFTEKRSRFIGRVFPATAEDEALACIARTRKTHWDANHNVYAYLLRDGGRKRYSDDGEPQGTAGLPVLEVLEREGLCDVCAVVTRYFGGILLGGGGLLRAYTRAAKLAVDAAERRTLHECADLRLKLDYSLYGPVARLLPQFGAQTLGSDFAEDVSLTVRLRAERREAFERALRELSAGGVAPALVGEPLAELD